MQPDTGASTCLPSSSTSPPCGGAGTPRRSNSNHADLHVAEEQADIKRLLSMFGVDAAGDRCSVSSGPLLNMKDVIEMLRPAAEKFHRCRSLAREAHAMKLIERLSCTFQ